MYDGEIMITSEIKNTLLTTRLNLFLKPNEIDTLLKYTEVVTFEPNEIVLCQGKKSEGLYFIIEGRADVTAKILGEGVINMEQLGHGNFIGQISVIENGPSSTSVIAKTPLICLLIKSNYFNVLPLFFPNIYYQITHAILHEVFERLKFIENKIKKLMDELHMTSASLFGVIIKSLIKASTIDFDNAGIDKKKLKNLDFFNIFNEDEYEELIKHATLIQTPVNYVLIHENEVEPNLYIILQGAVQSSIAQHNKFAKLFVLGPISLFCNISIIDSKLPSLIHYTTCERAIILKMTTSDLAIIKKSHIQLWYKIFDLICKSFIALEKAANKLDIRLNSELYNR